MCPVLKVGTLTSFQRTLLLCFGGEKPLRVLLDTDILLWCLSADELRRLAPSR